MKKGWIISLSAVLCLSPYIAGMPALAQSGLTQEVSAARFLEEYAGTTVTTTSKKGSSTTFSWFRTADESNAAILVEGYEVYQSLSASVQKEVLSAYKAQKMDYLTLVKNAQSVLDAMQQPEQQEQPDEPSTAEQTEAGQTEAGQTEAEDSKKQEESQTPAADPKKSRAADDAAGAADEAAEAAQEAASKEEADVMTNVTVDRPQTQKPEDSEESEDSEDSEDSEEPEDSKLPAVGSTTQDGKTVLFSDTLNTDSEEIVLQVAGRKADLAEGEAAAVSSWLSSLDQNGSTIYSQVVYSASYENRKAASSAMYAADTGRDLLLFGMSYYSAQKSYEIIQYSLDAISFDFTTGTLNPIVKSTYTFDYDPQPQTPTPETPDTPTVSEPEEEPEEVKEPEKQPSSGNVQAQPQGPSASAPVQQPQSAQPAGAQTQTSSAAASAAMAAQNKGQAATFIKTFMTGADGRLYTGANIYNYRQILNGYNSWKKLSADVRYEISSSLKEQTGKSFATLFTEANRIRLNQVQGGGAAANGLPYAAGNPQTATDSMAEVHIFTMMMSSLGFFVSLLRKKDII